MAFQTRCLVLLEAAVHAYDAEPEHAASDDEQVFGAPMRHGLSSFHDRRLHARPLRYCAFRRNLATDAKLLSTGALDYLDEI